MKIYTIEKATDYEGVALNNVFTRKGAAVIEAKKQHKKCNKTFERIIVLEWDTDTQKYVEIEFEN